MAFRIHRPNTAFSTAPVGGRPRQHSESHLKFIRELPCVVSGRRPVEAAHVSFADPMWAKRAAGMSEKADDCWVLPLSPALHASQHSTNERFWWKGTGIDPLALCAALWISTGDVERAEIIIKAHRAAAKEKLDGKAK